MGVYRDNGKMETTGIIGCIFLLIGDFPKLGVSFWGWGSILGSPYVRKLQCSFHGLCCAEEQHPKADNSECQKVRNRESLHVV